MEGTSVYGRSTMEAGRPSGGLLPSEFDRDTELCRSVPSASGTCCSARSAQRRARMPDVDLYTPFGPPCRHAMREGCVGVEAARGAFGGGSAPVPDERACRCLVMRCRPSRAGRAMWCGIAYLCCVIFHDVWNVIAVGCTLSFMVRCHVCRASRCPLRVVSCACAIPESACPTNKQHDSHET